MQRARCSTALCDFERATGFIAASVNGRVSVRLLAKVDEEGSLRHLVDAILRRCTESFCVHPDDHALGRALALLTTNGASLGHRLSALALCNTSFLLGCFHGAVQGLTLRRANATLQARRGGPVLDPVLAIDGQPFPGPVGHELRALAGSRLRSDFPEVRDAAMSAGIAYGEAVHALGHAAYMLSGAEPEAAATSCEELAAGGGGAEEGAARAYYCMQVGSSEHMWLSQIEKMSQEAKKKSAPARESGSSPISKKSS